MFSIERPALVVLDSPPQARVRHRRSLQQIQKKSRIVAGQVDHPLAFDHALCLPEGGLHDELVERRSQQICCLLQGLLYVLRHPSRDTAPIESGSSHGVDSRFVISVCVWSCQVDWQVVGVWQVVGAFSYESGNLAEIEYLAPVRDVLSNQYRSGSEVGRMALS